MGKGGPRPQPDFPGKAAIAAVVCLLSAVSLLGADRAGRGGQEAAGIWKEFVALVKAGSLPPDRIRPPEPMTRESQRTILVDFAKGAEWSEWEAAPEIVRAGDHVTFFVKLGAKRGSPWTYTFNFLVEDGRWYYRFLEGIVLRFDRVTALPADASGFPGLSEADTYWVREESYWSEQVRLFNFLSKEKGRETAFHWIEGGLANGSGYALAATVWIPFYPTPRAFILYLCWEQAKLHGDRITVEKLDDRQAVVRIDDSVYFALYNRSTHLRQQISLEDYIKIFETIWTERAKAAGWTLTIDGQGRRIYLRFSR